VPALKGTAGQTSSAGPAGLRKRTDDMIANADLCDVGTGCDDDPRELVTKHRWRRNEIVSGEEQVGVT
jgi:hypothetical protein